MISPCGSDLINVRRPVVPCAKCISGRTKPCKCCDSTGTHRLPGYTVSGSHSTGMAKAIQAGIAQHKSEKRRKAA